MRPCAISSRRSSLSRMAGDKAATGAFIDRWGTWNENLHGRIASALREQQQFRFRLFEYQALDMLRR